MEEAELKRDVNADNKKEMSSRKKNKEKEKNAGDAEKAADKDESAKDGAAPKGQQQKRRPAAPR